MYNKVILIGNLGRDPEVRRLEGGSAVGKFPVATNENYKDQSGNWQTKTEWHDVVVWRQLAERAERDLKKGSLVFVEGKLTHRKWQDKDGNNRYSTEVVANVVRKLEKSERNDMDDVTFPSAKDAPESSSSQMQETPADDDLPF
jgi:single-strand DNA-binding protein